MSDTEDGSEPWFFSGDSPIKNWADEEDDENDDLDFNNSWLEEKERGEPAPVGVHSDSRQGRTHGGGRATQMGPFNPARGGRGRRARGGGRGSNGGGSAGGTPRAAGSGLQPATPPRGGNKKNPPNGRTPSPAKAKGGKAEGREDVSHAHPPATAATPPKRNGKREPKKKIAQKFVAVNRPSPHSDSTGSPTKAGLPPVAALPREDNAYPPAAGGVEDGPTSALELSLSDGGPPYAEEAEVGIAHTLFPTVSDDFKSQMLLEMLPAADPAQSFIIFVRSNSTVVALAEQLDRLNLGTVALKEDDPVELITVYTDEFRMGKYRLLLIPEGIEAHTILSGLEHVTHAINYDVPDVDRYVARLGALRAEGDELIPLDVFTFITPLDEEAVLALEDIFGPLRRHIGSVSSSLQPQEEAHHTHPTYQEHVDSREYLHHQQKAQRAAQQHRQRRQDKGKLNSPVKQTKPAKTKHLKQPAKTQKEVKGFLPNATRFNTGAAESWRASPSGSRSTGARTSVGGGDRWRA